MVLQAVFRGRASNRRKLKSTDNDLPFHSMSVDGEKTEPM